MRIIQFVLLMSVFSLVIGSGSISSANKCSDILKIHDNSLAQNLSPINMFIRLNLMFPQEAEHLINAGLTAQYLVRMLPKKLYKEHSQDVTSVITAMENSHKSFGVDLTVAEERVRSIVWEKFTVALRSSAVIVHEYFAQGEAKDRLGLEPFDVWLSGDLFEVANLKNHVEDTRFSAFQNLLIDFLRSLESSKTKNLSLIYRKSLDMRLSHQRRALKDLRLHLKAEAEAEVSIELHTRQLNTVEACEVVDAFRTFLVNARLS